MAISRRDVENVIRTIFKRCLECPDTVPTCPSCTGGQVCSITASSCDTCAVASCINMGSDPNPGKGGSSGGPNVGAIVGAVVGGLAVICVIVFAIWKFCLKGRRQPMEEEEWEPEELPQEKANNDFTMRRDARSSTHTVASFASTVLTRASNIIQIAYIPGVTNRTGPQSPGLLVPPVPPIPIATTSSTATSPYSTEDQHFFLPGDIRDSSYSGFTDDSYARTSVAPSLARGSVASTIYRNNAIVSPVPAQTVVRGKAAMVSVKSSSSNSPVGTPEAFTPPVPQIDTSKYAPKPVKVQMLGAPAEGPGISPSGSVRSTATVGKPMALTITKGRAVPARSPSARSEVTTPGSGTATPTSANPLLPLRPDTSQSFLSLDSDDDSEMEPDHARSRRSLLRSSSGNSSSVRDSNITDIADTPGAGQGPFADSNAQPEPRNTGNGLMGIIASKVPEIGSGIRSPQQRGSGLSTVAEDDESRRGSRVSGGGNRNRSPFGDEHEVR